MNTDYRNAADDCKMEAVKAGCANIVREQTVGEYLDDRIFQAIRVADALRDLKSSLPGSFLVSGASRISALTLPR